jgi:hypothetical protein
MYVVYTFTYTWFLIELKKYPHIYAVTEKKRMKNTLYYDVPIIIENNAVTKKRKT